MHRSDSYWSDSEAADSTWIYYGTGATWAAPG